MREMIKTFNTNRIFPAALLLLMAVFQACAEERYVEVIDIEPVVMEGLVSGARARPDFEAMHSTLQKAGDLYTMTYHGDFDELIELQHGMIIQQLEKAEEERNDSIHCSMFSYFDGDGGSILGRNFDNRFTEVIVGLFFPDSGYVSIGFVPLMEFGMGRELMFDPDNVHHRQAVLHGPGATIEGMNEKGVVVGLASLDRRKVTQEEGKESRFLIHLVREILDHAGSVDEAVGIARRYNVFDNGTDVITHHILISGPGGRSIVLEWVDGSMNVIESGGGRQIVTNSNLLGVTENDRRRSCGRYKAIHKKLEKYEGPMSWQDGMDILAEARQRSVTYRLEGEKITVSTQWSAVFDAASGEIFISMYRDLSKIYRIKLGDREYYRNIAARGSAGS
jgi:hypothetical protein